MADIVSYMCPFRWVNHDCDTTCDGVRTVPNECHVSCSESLEGQVYLCLLLFRCYQNIVYRLQTKFQEGNIFTGVYLSTRGKVSLVPGSFQSGRVGYPWYQVLSSG